jgi:hypothetical protein
MMWRRRVRMQGGEKTEMSRNLQGMLWKSEKEMKRTSRGNKDQEKEKMRICYYARKMEMELQKRETTN